MILEHEKLKCARDLRTAYMENHSQKRMERPVKTVVPLKGIRNAIKRFFRRQWVKEGYLEDAEWLLNNASNKMQWYALANLNRNGWGQAQAKGSEAESVDS